MGTESDRYSLQPEGPGVVLWDNYQDEPVSVAVAKSRLNRGQRAIDAAQAALSKLDYLQSLWGKEGVTNSLAEHLRNALTDEPED